MFFKPLALCCFSFFLSQREGASLVQEKEPWGHLKSTCWSLGQESPPYMRVYFQQDLRAHDGLAVHFILENMIHASLVAGIYLIIDGGWEATRKWQARDPSDLISFHWVFLFKIPLSPQSCLGLGTKPWTHGPLVTLSDLNYNCHPQDHFCLSHLNHSQIVCTLSKKRLITKHFILRLEPMP